MNKKLIISVSMLVFILTVALFLIKQDVISLKGNDNVPVYLLDGNKLVRGDSTYVSDNTEFWFEPVSWGNRIGKTKNGDSIFEIKGQSPKDWVMVKGLMFQGIYRNINIKPIDVKTLPFNQLRIPEMTPVKTTTDNKIINSLLDSISTTNFSKTNVSDYQSFEIQMLTPELQGIACFTHYVVLDKKNNRVFVSKRETPEEIAPAGDLFAQWIKQN